MPSTSLLITFADSIRDAQIDSDEFRVAVRTFQCLVGIEKPSAEQKETVGECYQALVERFGSDEDALKELAGLVGECFIVHLFADLIGVEPEGPGLFLPEVNAFAAAHFQTCDRCTMRMTLDNMRREFAAIHGCPRRTDGN